MANSWKKSCTIGSGSLRYLESSVTILDLLIWTFAHSLKRLKFTKKRAVAGGRGKNPGNWKTIASNFSNPHYAI